MAKQDNIEEVLIDIYLSGNEWKQVVHPPHGIDEYCISQEERDAIGTRVRYFKLNIYGKMITEFILKRMGHKIGPPRGFAVEKREWLIQEPWDVSMSQAVRGFRKISELSGIPVEVIKEGDRKRVIFKNIEKAISIVAAQIEWETNRSNPDHLSKIGWPEYLQKMWMVLDTYKKDLRRIPYQQEFVLWDDS